MTTHQRVSSGSTFEDVFGYSRAVRVGPWISVAGCTAAAPGGPVGGADVVAQTREALTRIAGALEQTGASTADVVRTRIFVTDISTWELVGPVHKEFFADVLPASTFVEVSGLIHPELLVEIEADAVAGD